MFRILKHIEQLTGVLWTSTSGSSPSSSTISDTSTARHAVSKRPCGPIERIVKTREMRLAHSGLSGNFCEGRKVHTVIGSQPITFREVARLTTKGRCHLDGEIPGPLGLERLLGRCECGRSKRAFPATSRKRRASFCVGDGRSANDRSTLDELTNGVAIGLFDIELHQATGV
jgi:hypothetical protein